MMVMMIKLGKEEGSVAIANMTPRVSFHVHIPSMLNIYRNWSFRFIPSSSLTADCLHGSKVRHLSLWEVSLGRLLVGSSAIKLINGYDLFVCLVSLGLSSRSRWVCN